MRCPDCNKFVPYNTDEEPEPQDDPSIDGDTLAVDVRRLLTCAECGGELKEATITLETDLAWVRPAAEEGGEIQAGHAPGCDADEFDFDLEYSPTEDVQTTDRRGKTITNPRYMRTLYGVHVSGSVTCEGCGAVADVDAEESEAASAFDELV